MIFPCVSSATECPNHYMYIVNILWQYDCMMQQNITMQQDIYMYIYIYIYIYFVIQTAAKQCTDKKE